MIRAGTGVSGASAASVAVTHAAQAALAALGAVRPDAALLVATPQHAGSFDEALRAFRQLVGDVPLAGATVDGVLTSGVDLEAGPALGVLLLSGVEARSVLVHDIAKIAAAAGEEVVHALGRVPSAEDLLVLLPDPAGCDLRALLAGARGVMGDATLVGSGAADAGDGSARILASGEIATGALAGLWIRGAGRPRAGVTSSCRPVAGPFVVTRAEGHWVLSLDGRPALDVYREAAREPLARDLLHAFSFLLVAVPRAPGVALTSDALVVRSVAGVSERRGAFALPEPVVRGQQIALVLRDAQGARDALRAMLERLAAPPPACGLYFDCRERGAALFGMAGLEAAYLERALPGVPVLGLRGSCELGPIGGEPALLTHAAVLALIPA
jgi:small ligand-binding sensory domain FIST